MLQEVGQDMYLVRKLVSRLDSCKWRVHIYCFRTRAGPG